MIAKAADGNTALLIRIERTRRTDNTHLLSSCPAIQSYAYLETGAQQGGDLLVEISDLPQKNARYEVKLRDAEVAWWHDRAHMRCTRETAYALLPGLAAFAQLEAELGRLEGETEASWGELAEDRPIVFEATPADLQRSRVIGTRVAAAFDRRVRFSRLGDCLLSCTRPGNGGAAALADKLEEAAGLEDRMEVLDGHLEVFEHIYEMVSQRLGEFRASHQGNRVEWIIIALLAVEIVLMLLAGWHGTRL